MGSGGLHKILGGRPSRRADGAAPWGSPAPTYGMRRHRGAVRALALIAALGAIGIGGYVLGASAERDAGDAELAGRAAGAQAGEAAGPRAGSDKAYANAREAAYGAAFEAAYREAYLREFEQADLAPPASVRVREP